MWDWLINPSNSAVVGAVGLIVSITGFATTLIQLSRTRKAAVAASNAASAATARFNSFNALRECEAAKQQAKKVNDAISEGRWELSLDQYQPLLKHISNLRQSNVELDADVHLCLEDAEQIITRNCLVIERAISNKAGSLTKGKQFAALRPIDAAIAKKYFNIERIG